MDDALPPEPAPSIQDFLYGHETAAHLAFYSAVGRTVVLWGDLEHGFGLQVMFLYHSEEARGLEHRPPYQLSKKISFWRKCFDNIPFLQNHKKQGHRFADALRDLAKERDTIVHFNWSAAIDSLKPFQASIAGRSVMGKEDGHYLLGSEIDLHELIKMAERIADLKSQLVGFILIVNALPSNRASVEKRLQPPTQP